MSKALSFLIILIGIGLLWLVRDAHPVIRLAFSSLVLLFFVKGAAWIWQRGQGQRFESKLGFFLYLFGWPGVLTEGFQKRLPEPPATTGLRFLESWLTFLLGVGLLLVSALLGKGEVLAFNYLALFSILLILHLGFIEVVADGFRLLGFQPKSLFDRPFLSKTLSEFWGRRWNIAFVDMNKLFILTPLKGRFPKAVLVFSIFLLSGILHELAISFSDGVSWGWPLTYFVFQGFGVLLERKIPLPRGIVLLWILAPIPILFTPAFTQLFLGSLCQQIYGLVTSFALVEWLGIGLLLGGVLHLLVLVASLQVPHRLDWKNEFLRLRPLNRKVVWTYGGYILSLIIFMSFVSFYLFYAKEWQSGAGKLWVLFIALFWWARILIDFFYMEDKDWPEGPLFKVGHVCLTTLFVTMTLLYSSIAVLLYWGGSL